MKKFVFVLDIVAFLLLVMASGIFLVLEGFSVAMPWLIAAFWCLICILYKIKYVDRC